MTNGSLVDVSHSLTGRAGRKRIEIDPTMISSIPLRLRTNIRVMESAANMSKSTIHKRIKEGAIRPHSKTLKPALTDDNKKARLLFSLSMLEDYCFANKPIFKSMYNYVHIDEKWFYMTKESQKYYLLPKEDEPLRSCKSKRFITKVMFLAVVARPRYDSANNEEFSGKIGIFSFTFQEPAQRNSKNRTAGTMETKAILSVTKDVICLCLINKVFPAIRSKWPRSSNMEPIFIQQDNAKPHINPNDQEFLEDASKDGFDIRLSFQPPNSPDFNVLDLGYFRAIQSLQYRYAPSTIDELVQVVQESFENLSSENLNYVFLTF
ncbi:uncharacterized protein LOC113359240 [Papaver somniferum]|uniref:uncharacterized protein LOC113359240 n=1 Tax=Papaver somniferum TaxID=3469 RepID=UPI000E6FD0CA|nr:uncharacterized protein LOC113359240 [Papaver somniferum]